MTYTVVYYQGGALAGEWRRCAPEASIEAARSMRSMLMSMGYPAWINTTEWWDRAGLPSTPPVWWDFATLAPKADARMLVD